MARIVSSIGHERMTEQLVQFLGQDLVKLLVDGQKLLQSPNGDYYDYSFTLFPFAKAYEGYLKKLLFNIGAITQNQYESDHWRVGKALNPQLEKEVRHDESVYDRIVEKCGSPDPHSLIPSPGQKMADIFWEAWKNGRNRIFHYFPAEYHPVTLEEAKKVSEQLVSAMEQGLLSCSAVNH